LSQLFYFFHRFFRHLFFNIAEKVISAAYRIRDGSIYAGISLKKIGQHSSYFTFLASKIEALRLIQ